jgi:hypothetical protein
MAALGTSLYKTLERDRTPTDNGRFPPARDAGRAARETTGDPTVLDAYARH